MANLNETAIHEDMKKCLNESTELERLAEQAVNYFKSKNFEVTMFDKNFFDFKGKCTNEKGQEVDSEGSFEIFEDGEIDYSASHVIDGKEIDSITETISKYDKLEDAIDCIIAPVFEDLEKPVNESIKEPFSDFSNLIDFGYVLINGKIKVAVKLAFNFGCVYSAEPEEFFESISEESNSLNKEIALIVGKVADDCSDFCNFEYKNGYHAVVWTYKNDEEIEKTLVKNGIEENNDASFFDIANH